MKYAILFTLAGVLIAILGVNYGGWYLVLFWPAASFIAIGIAYFRRNPSVFGKKSDGSISNRSTLLLLPYLLYLQLVWHVVRFVSREDAFNQLSDNLTIGRRLLPSEFSEQFDVVADLTCEFIEPRQIRTSREYVVYPILDGAAPSAQTLALIALQLAKENRHLYVHCAQGHGRTGLVAAAILCAKGLAKDSAVAIAVVRAKRPGVRLDRAQVACLQETIALLADRTEDLGDSGPATGFTSPNPSSPS